VAAITVDATSPADADRIARAMYGWPGDRTSADHISGTLYHVTLWGMPR
jgi:hypothetical protein